MGEEVEKEEKEAQERAKEETVAVVTQQEGSADGGMGVQDAADWGSEVPVGGAPGAPIVPAGQQAGFAAPTEDWAMQKTEDWSAEPAPAAAAPVAPAPADQ